MSHKSIKRPPAPRPAKVTRLDADTIHLDLDDQTAPESWPSVSLCMIVKNEEENLADCLASVGDFASEIIIVDTGSTDRTVEIATKLGARVEHFTWIDDFSAARNESLKYAAGDWIFWMDADDRLAPNELNRLKNALVSGLAEAYYCTVISDVGRQSGVASTVTHLRLFPNRSGLHFINPIHEDVTPVAIRLGLRRAYTNIAIHHVGYAVADENIQIRRGARNEQIIRKVMAAEPDNRRLHYDLAAALHLQGDYPGVIEQIKLLLADLPPAEQLDREVYLYHAHVLLVAAYSKLGQLEAALQAIDQAKQDFPHRRHLWGTAGIILWQQGQLEEAVAAFERALSIPPHTEPEGFAYQPGQLEKLVSRPLWLLGRPEPARAAYGAMLTAQRSAPAPVTGAVWSRARQLFHAGQDQALLDWLTPQAAGDPAALRWLYQAAARQELWSAAFFYLLDAIILSEPHAEEWPDLMTVALKAGMAAIAARIGQLWLAQADSVQDQAVACNLLGMSAFQQQDFDQAAEHFCQALLANPADPQAALNNLSVLARVLELPLAAVIQRQAARWLKQEAYSDALNLLNSTLDKCSEPAEWRKLMAVSLQKLGRAAEAIQMWQTAQTLKN